MAIYLDNATRTRPLTGRTDVTDHFAADALAQHFAGRHTGALRDEARFALSEAMGITEGRMFFATSWVQSWMALLDFALHRRHISQIALAPGFLPLLADVFKRFARLHAMPLHALACDEAGRIDKVQLEATLKGSPNTFVVVPHLDLLSLSLAPIKDLQQMAGQHSALLAVDYSHTWPYMPLHMGDATPDMAVATAEAAYGWPNTSWIYLRQPDDFGHWLVRENDDTMAISAMLKAALQSEAEYAQRRDAVNGLKHEMCKYLIEMGVENFIYDNQSHGFESAVNVLVPTSRLFTAQSWGIHMDLRNVAVRTYTLNESQAVVQFYFSVQNTLHEMRPAAKALSDILQFYHTQA